MRKNGNTARLILALVLTLLLSTAWLAIPASASFWFWETEESGPAASAIEDDGMLRVYLKSLGSPKSLDIT